ncbi:MAG: Uncharacterised protein [Methanobacteriota archaeon]|nr:MAG: Uncharacterised protein [Euryarchaeota archaeon]
MELRTNDTNIVRTFEREILCNRNRNHEAAIFAVITVDVLDGLEQETRIRVVRGILVRWTFVCANVVEVRPFITREESIMMEFDLGCIGIKHRTNDIRYEI